MNFEFARSKSKMGVEEETSPSSFSILQEKHVNPKILKCCPTMDLIAVYTMDQQLVVYRTISWQRILHVKAAEIGSPITTLCWSPDGYLLATGNEDGEIDMYDIEKGEPLSTQYQLPEDTASQHTAKITAMHWISPTSNTASSQKRMDSIHSRSSRLGSTVFGSSSSSSFSLSTAATESTSTTKRSSHQENVMVTADINGMIHIWFLGRVLVASVSLSQIQPLKSKDCSIEDLWLMPDLSQLYLILTIKNNEVVVSKQLVSVHIPQLQVCQEQLGVIAQVASEVQFLLSEITSSFRQINTEWKNTTRVFELKMSLMGSLYDKYGYEDPPQVDMLSLMCSGISSPALAQYFAQDLPEQSVARMQKTFATGCQTILSLMDKRWKKSLIRLFFLFSELRGHTKWKSKEFSQHLSLFPKQLTNLLEMVQKLLETSEKLQKYLQKTQQDFVLLFQWFLEQIRIHTGTKVGAIDRSRLNHRQLCCFMEQAAEFAKQFQAKHTQTTTQKYKVETTFGNPVTQFLTKPQPKDLIVDQITQLRRQWVQVLTQVTQVPAQSISSDQVHVIELGDNLQEYHFHCRQPFQKDDDDSRMTDDDNDKNDDDDEEEEEEEEEEEDDFEDWDDFFMMDDSSNKKTSTITRDISPTVVFGLRYSKNQEFCDDRLILLRKRSQEKWEVANMTFPLDTSLVGFDFYGGWSTSSTLLTSTEQEQLTLLCNKTEEGDSSEANRKDELCLQPYDHLKFIPVSRTSESGSIQLTEVLGKLTSWSSRAFIPTSRRRKLSYPFKNVISNAQRGIVCVLSSAPKILTVLDVNEDDDEEEEEEEEEG